MADSRNTRQALAQALRQLVPQKGFDKISVSDITTACGMGRQSFYYHFQDKFELLEWIYQTEAFAPFCQGLTLENWHQRMGEMLRILETERSFYLPVTKAQPQHFEDCLFQILEALFLSIVDQIDERGTTDRERRQFAAAFYARGCCAVVLQWMVGGMRFPSARLADDLFHLAKDSERAAARITQGNSGDS